MSAPAPPVVSPSAPSARRTILDMLSRWMCEQPLAVAARHAARELTYGELDQLSGMLAADLRRRGVGRGDRIGIFVERGFEMVVAIVAALRLGAAYVPVDPRIATEVHMAHVVAVTGMRVVLTQARFADRMTSATGILVVPIERARTADADASSQGTVAPRAGDECVIIFTSGTTGTPNGVRVTHRNLENFLFGGPGALGMKPGTVVAQILNIAFDMAVWEILGALTHGATLHIRGRDFAEALRAADVVIATPSILTPHDPRRLGRFTAVAVAGERCPRALANRWAAVTDFYNSCGPTEITIVNTMHLCTPDEADPPIGRPIPGTTAYILDEGGAPVADGEVGEMWVGGAGVTAGYLGNPRLTRDRYRLDPFSDDGSLMFRTRDLARWNADGDLEHLGRTDDQVKIRGFRVEPDAVSALLEREDSVQHAAVLPTDDRTALVAFVTPEDADVEAALAHVREALPYYCVPKIVHLEPALPMTTRGKVDQTVLRSHAWRAA
ncbi:amino acid adenylation domain-containing protein [Microbacterium sp. As-52]|uniref:amino acid adenylation domain-containing protein n=1 Tax=Microbacterium sp. As-52 TaxID=3390503 RepID=UPI003CF91092